MIKKRGRSIIKQTLLMMQKMFLLKHGVSLFKFLDFGSRLFYSVKRSCSRFTFLKLTPALKF